MILLLQDNLQAMVQTTMWDKKNEQEGKQSIRRAPACCGALNRTFGRAFDSARGALAFQG